MTIILNKSYDNNFIDKLFTISKYFKTYYQCKHKKINRNQSKINALFIKYIFQVLKIKNSIN